METGKTALITGASSGIGEALARLMAEKGHPLVLVARRAERLEQLASQLNTPVSVIPLDLNEPEAASRLLSEVNARSLQIDVLINNAGLGGYGKFDAVSTERVSEMMQVNMVALTAITKAFLPAMLARRSGRILNVASTAAFQPGPLMAVYYATKAYVLSLSEALSNELEGTGITVTALCPGPTSSEFQDVAKMQQSSALQRLLLTSEQVAEEGYEGMMRGRRVVIPGWRNRLLVHASRFAPRSLTLKIVRNLQEERKPED